MAGLLGKKFPTPIGMQDYNLECSKMRSSDFANQQEITDIDT